jgi:AP-4 complex subunit sigma-1
MDKYFESVCELDIMFHIEKAYYIVEEMVANGAIIENNKEEINESPTTIMELPSGTTELEKTGIERKK